MSEIKKLIERLCPDGVEYKKLGELGTFYGGLTGKSKKDFGNGNAKFITYMNVYSNPALNLSVTDTVQISEGEKQNKVQYKDILFTGSSETPDESGMTSVVTQEVDEDFYLNSFCFGLRLYNPELFNADFLKHYFRSHEARKAIVRTASGVTRFNVSKAKLASFEIPVPPIEVQSKIVEILDKFTELETELEAELKAELEARRKQYEYYRNQLLTFDKVGGARFERLGDVCKIERGVRVVRKDLEIKGDIPVYQNSLIPLGYYMKSNYPENTPFIICGGGAGQVGFSTKPYWAADDCFSIVCPNSLNSKFVYYSMLNKNNYFISRVRKASIPRLSRSSVESFEIAIPPLEEQKRIVSILDRFEALTTDLQSGLPAEIEARRKQYEYYREKLLTFKRKTA